MVFYYLEMHAYEEIYKKKKNLRKVQKSSYFDRICRSL